MQKFEDYLEEIFNNDESDGLLDDDLADGFSDWLGTLDGDEYINYAQDFALQCYQEGVLAGMDRTIEAIKN